jgi:hypothetical protein
MTSNVKPRQTKNYNTRVGNRNTMGDENVEQEEEEEHDVVDIDGELLKVMGHASTSKARTFCTVLRFRRRWNQPL